jgi:hypothetical protein
MGFNSAFKGLINLTVNTAKRYVEDMLNLSSTKRLSKCSPSVHQPVYIVVFGSLSI